MILFNKSERPTNFISYCYFLDVINFNRTFRFQNYHQNSFYLKAINIF